LKTFLQIPIQNITKGKIKTIYKNRANKVLSNNSIAYKVSKGLKSLFACTSFLL